MLALSLSASAFVAPGLAPRLPSADFGMTHGSRLANLQMVQARAQLFGTILSAAHILWAARNSLTPTLLQAPLLDGLNCGSMNERLATSVEVTASKIFPAGAGWQLASIVADSAGFAPTSLAFFAAVGLGDCTGVFLGHLAYQTLKKVTGAKLNLKDEFQTASLLGTAAFFSGGIWQPALNAFNTLGYTFTQSLVGVSLATTFAFFAGLRIMRRVLSQFMPAVENVTYDNQESDLALSAAVGTGCGAFVGTDVSFGAANWLAPVVGIQEKFGAARACVAAGLSTSIGFMANMVVQAAALPAKACWIDADYANPRAA